LQQLNKKLSCWIKVRDLLVLQTVLDEVEDLSEDEERVKVRIDAMIARAKVASEQGKFQARKSQYPGQGQGFAPSQAVGTN
jgi:hypothetical protein